MKSLRDELAEALLAEKHEELLDLQQEISDAAVRIYRVDKLIAAEEAKVKSLLQRQLVIAIIEDVSMKTNDLEEKVNFFTVQIMVIYISY